MKVNQLIEFPLQELRSIMKCPTSLVIIGGGDDLVRMNDTCVYLYLCTHAQFNIINNLSVVVRT